MTERIKDTGQMMMLKKLSEMKKGEEGEIFNILAKGEIRKRLIDFGILKGCQFRVIRKAPLGDPIEIRINNFLLSLRLEEAELIQVRQKL
ncbi:MAG: ferrous iron transport protein A [Sphingobacteriales bacterium]|nr:ferrous iron transport protein A [Sphingobacteriales bacterium]